MISIDGRLCLAASAGLVIALCMPPGCATPPAHFASPAAPSVAGLEETLARIENERLLFLGEAHNNSSDHLLQLEVLRHLSSKGRRLAVALEVFPAERQAVLDAWIAGQIDSYTFELACDRIWDELYSYYGEIFRFCRSTGTPMFGITPGKGFIASVARQGTVIVPQAQLEEIGFSGCAGHPEYERLMKTVAAMNVHEASMPHFCDAQRLLDTIMAKNISVLLEHQDITVVVLMGATHASTIAVPAILSGYGPLSYKVLLPASFRDMLPRGLADRFADYFWY